MSCIPRARQPAVCGKVPLFAISTSFPSWPTTAPSAFGLLRLQVTNASINFPMRVAGRKLRRVTRCISLLSLAEARRRHRLERGQDCNHRQRCAASVLYKVREHSPCLGSIITKPTLALIPTKDSSSLPITHIQHEVHILHPRSRSGGRRHRRVHQMCSR
jgi:hypothetical protein